MNDNEKLVEFYAQFAKRRSPQITSEIAGVLAAKEQHIRQLLDETGSALGPRIPSEGVEHERSSFGGELGEPVPQVDPEDVKAAWEVGRDMERGIQVDSMQSGCKFSRPPANPVRIFQQSATGE